MQCFIGLENAFESIPREEIWRIMQGTGVENKLLEAIKTKLYKYACTTRNYKSLSQTKEWNREIMLD